ARFELSPPKKGRRNHLGNRASGRQDRAAPDSAGRSAAERGHDRHGADWKGAAGHGVQDGGIHQKSGQSDPEPVENTLVGGFIGLNALVVAMAAFLKLRARRRVAE
ncbi:MAG: hypothetical protein M1609_16990, partial [Firmicutes bacterium]|nr:hypothetical protein [Bacillota bacterium]